MPCKPLRQWVLSLPFALRFLLATNPQLLTQVLGIVYRTISGDLLHAAGRTRSTAATGAVTLIQRLAARSTSTFTCTCCFSMAFTFEQRWERARRRSRCFSVWQRRAAQRVTERIGRALERQGYWYETRLKRVFAIDIETCRRCDGRLKVIASIEEPEVSSGLSRTWIERSRRPRRSHRGCRHRRHSSDPLIPSTAVRKALTRQRRGGFGGPSGAVRISGPDAENFCLPHSSAVAVNAV